MERMNRWKRVDGRRKDNVEMRKELEVFMVFDLESDGVE